MQLHIDFAITAHLRLIHVFSIVSDEDGKHCVARADAAEQLCKKPPPLHKVGGVLDAKRQGPRWRFFGQKIMLATIDANAFVIGPVAGVCIGMWDLQKGAVYSEPVRDLRERRF